MLRTIFGWTEGTGMPRESDSDRSEVECANMGGSARSGYYVKSIVQDPPSPEITMSATGQAHVTLGPSPLALHRPGLYGVRSWRLVRLSIA